MTRRPSRRRAAVLTSVVLTAALGLAACGSRVAPATMATLAGGSAVAGGSGTGDGLTSGSGDFGSTDPGAVADGGTGVSSVGSSGGGDPGSAGGGSASGGSSADGGGSGATQGEGKNAAAGGARAASCDGFKNGTGITKDKIVLGNASDISGPVPGLFQSSQDGARAYVAYFNAQNDICGRELEILDSRSDNGANEANARELCSKVFAAVGSMSAFDAGGSSTTQSCGLPDLRAVAVNPERNKCNTCFSAQAVNPSLVPRSMPRYFAREYPQAVKKAATLYVNSGAAPVNARSQAEGWRRNGVNVVYEAAIDTSEFNYAPYVQQLKSRGIGWVQYVGPYQFAVRLAQAMKQQNYKPGIYVLDVTGYDKRYVESGGDAVADTRLWLPTGLFERADKNEEMGLYLAWLNQVKPGAEPTTFGLFAWSATRLLVQEAIKLGGRLDRASLVAALGKVSKWTSNGLHSPQEVGAKRTTDCQRIMRLRDGAWVQESPGEYMCEGLTDTGIGG